jgi:choloylglycine hydrolase
MIRKAAVLTLIAAATPGFACTGISLKAQDGAAIRGRTLEFGFPMQSNVLVIPAGGKGASSTLRATPLSAPMRSGFPPSSTG